MNTPNFPHRGLIHFPARKSDVNDGISPLYPSTYDRVMSIQHQPVCSGGRGWGGRVN